MNAAAQEIQVWSESDVGRKRANNEDTYLIDQDLKLYVVCDGMGGHSAGDVASQTAADAIQKALYNERDIVERFSEERASRSEVLSLMERAVQSACATVHAIAADPSDDSKRGMGTTLEALLIIGNRGFIAHVGDSRIYLVRQGVVHQLTEDHSLINELLKRGKITQDQVASFKYKNAVTRAVGVYESVEVDVFDFDVLSGDRYLICSDGLYEYFEESELPRLFRTLETANLAKYFVDLANERGGKDNITAVVIQHGVEEESAHADEVTHRLETLHRMPLFRFLSYQELVRVMNITQLVECSAGTDVVKEGEEGDDVFIVLDGRVRVHAGGAPIAVLEGGQHFGELALIDRTTRSASVSPTEDTRLLKITRHDFFNLVRTHHDLAVKLLWSFLGVLSQRLRQTSSELGSVRAALTAEELSSDLLSTVNPGPSEE